MPKVQYTFCESGHVYLPGSGEVFVLLWFFANFVGCAKLAHYFAVLLSRLFVSTHADGLSRYMYCTGEVEPGLVLAQSSAGYMLCTVALAYCSTSICVVYV